MLFHVFVVGCDGLPILLAPAVLLYLMEFFLQGLFECGRQIDFRAPGGVEQVTADADIGGAFGHGAVGRGHGMVSCNEWARVYVADSCASILRMNPGRLLVRT